jgi:hypothetical protein
MATCEQIETLASSILSAALPGDPGDQRAEKLGEVLRYLEQRIDATLALHTDQATAPETAPRSSGEPLHRIVDEAVASPAQFDTSEGDHGDNLPRPVPDAPTSPTPTVALPAETPSESEPADFLLGPLPLPQIATRDQGPSEASVSSPAPAENTAEVDEELFTNSPAPIPTQTSWHVPPADGPRPRINPNEPLAALSALSDEERIALFT